MTNVNALGEKTITLYDALGRAVRSEVRGTANTLVREANTAYRTDHHGMTVTNGSGGAAFVSTTFTDNSGQPVLTVAVPASGIREYTRTRYDEVGNRWDISRRAATNSNASVELSYWNGAFDELDRLIYEFRQDALTFFSYDAMGNLTNRSMPGSLSWRARYNNAGQMFEEYDLGTGSAATRTNTYSYFNSSSAFAGLLQSRAEGRGVTCAYIYDDWLRPTTNTHTGALDEQKVQTVWNYNARGLLTNATETFTSGSSPTTTVRRGYDAYGLLISESIHIGAALSSAASITWDSAGRRNALGLGSFGFSYGWRADGTLSGTAGPTGGGAYAYDTAGLLTNRTVGARTSAVTSRDGMGRILTADTKISGVSKLAETLAWTSDGLLSTHSLVRPDYTNSQSYFYQSFSRRLVEERLNTDNSTRWTNKFTYDNSGSSGGAGVLTRNTQAATTADVWSGARDAFQRVNSETNALVRRSAYGRINGPATVSLLLDGKAMPVTLVGTQGMQWRSTLEMGTGTHQLQASATHLSGQFTTNTIAWFTNNAANEIVTDTFDGTGLLTQRTWKTGSTTNRTQALAWDGRGRLWRVTERDASNSGFNWTALYDAFGRRLWTTNIVVTNGVAVTSQPKTIAQIYDPSVEFLELAVNENGRITWKLHGPDLNGRYGGLNGTGGFDAIIPGVDLFCPTLSDARGNVHAVYDQTHGSLMFNSSRPTGYGAVPAYRPLPLSHGGNIVSSSAWRGRWDDITGFTWLGARYYDPIAGRFLSADSLGHASDVSLYSFANGDPVNGFDPDGRFVKKLVVAGMEFSPGVFFEGTRFEAAWDNEAARQWQLAGEQRQWVENLPANERATLGLPVPFLYNTVHTYNTYQSGNAGALDRATDGLMAEGIFVLATAGMSEFLGGAGPRPSVTAPQRTTFFVTPGGQAIPNIAAAEAPVVTIADQIALMRFGPTAERATIGIGSYSTTAAEAALLQTSQETISRLGLFSRSHPAPGGSFFSTSETLPAGSQVQIGSVQPVTLPQGSSLFPVGARLSGGAPEVILHRRGN